MDNPNLFVLYGVPGIVGYRCLLSVATKVMTILQTGLVRMWVMLVEPLHHVVVVVDMIDVVTERNGFLKDWLVIVEKSVAVSVGGVEGRQPLSVV